MKIGKRWQQLNRLYFTSSTIYPDLQFQDDCDGLRQFIEYDSHGVKPAEPDRYYLRLCNGKEWYNWTRTGYQRAYFGNSEDGTELFRWPGLRQLWEDWKGERSVLREFLSWYPSKLPDSFFEEGDRFPKRDVDNAHRVSFGQAPMGDDWPKYEDEWDDFIPTAEMVQRLAMKDLELTIRRTAAAMEAR